MKAEEKTYKHDLRQNIPAEQDTRTLDLNIYGKWSQPKTFTRKEFEAQYAQLGDEELSRAWDYLLHIKGDNKLLLDIEVDKEISLEFEDRAWNKFFKDTEALDHKDLSKVEGIIKKELRKFLNSNQENTEEAKYILGTDLVIYVWGETDYSDDTKFLNIQVTTKEREVLEAMTLNRLEDSKEVAKAIEKHLQKPLEESTNKPSETVVNSVHDDKYAYGLLSRFIADIKYFNGAGNGHVKHLWARDVEKHITNTYYLYDKLVEKNGPIEWITKEDLDEMVSQMKKKEITEQKENSQNLEDRLKQLTQKLTELYDELGWLESLLNKDLRVGEEADIRELMEDTMYWINWHQVEIASVKGKRK